MTVTHKRCSGQGGMAHVEVTWPIDDPCRFDAPCPVCGGRGEGFDGACQECDEKYDRIGQLEEGVSGLHEDVQEVERMLRRVREELASLREA